MKSIVLTITEKSDDEWRIDVKAKGIKTEKEVIQMIEIFWDRLLCKLAQEEIEEATNEPK